MALLVLILALAVLAILAALLAALERVWPYLVLIAVGGLVFDGVVYLQARRRGEIPDEKLRATRKLAAVAAWPFRTGWRWLRAMFGHPVVPPVRVASIGELLMLTATEFEEAIAQSLRDHGYRHVSRRGGPGDLGVDITCIDPNGERLAIQCKRYAPGNLVGSRELQLFIGMIHTEHDVDRGVYVTTSGFTAPARELALRHNIRLLDGYELAHTFGLDGPPIPSRQAPEKRVVVDGEEAIRTSDGSVFCPMSDDELAAFEEMVRGLAVTLPVEVVRSLDESGRRGIVFSSTQAMVDAAALLEKAADRAEGLIEPTPPPEQTYRRRAQNAVILDMLRNGGDRSYELPSLPQD
jgi:restriction system protein